MARIAPSSTRQLPDQRGRDEDPLMEPLIDTLTLATILLIIGLTCTALGLAGLVWATTRTK